NLQSYDPATTATWTARAPMPDKRRYPIAVSLGGLLYVLGGAAQFPHPASETVRSYDPTTDAWTDRPPMPTVRVGRLNGPVTGAAATAEGKLYVIGGDQQANFDALDPATNSWTKRTSPPHPPLGATPP